MSTITLDCHEVSPVRRVPAIGRILVFSSLALIGITILLTAISVSAALSNQAALSQNRSVPVPASTAPTPDIQPLPSGTRAPSSGLASRLSVQPIPVPPPPVQ
jgi:hypothetical protein